MGRTTALVLLAGLLATSCSSDGDASSETASESTSSSSCAERRDEMDVAYVGGGAPRQRLDVYQPDAEGCAAVPLVVWVHGGGWMTGDKRNGIESKVDVWTDAGWAVASIDYRLTDADDPPATRLMAPSHDEDVAAAIGWLVDEADELGVDPDRIAVAGHSAGAGIVAAVANDPTYLEAEGLVPSDLACVAPLDTEGFDVEAVVSSGGRAAGIYRAVFGTDPTGWQELSPITHIGEAELPPTFLVTRGEPGRRAQVASYTSALREAGGEVTVTDLPGFTHGQVSTRIGDPDDDVLTPALMDFLSGCLG